jgi:hypothetical protein
MRPTHHQKLQSNENNPHRRVMFLTMWIFLIALVIFATASILIFKYKIMMYVFAIAGALSILILTIVALREIFNEMYESILDIIEKRKQ